MDALTATAVFDETTRTYQKYKLQAPWVGQVYVPKTLMSTPPKQIKVTIEPEVVE